MEGNGAPGVLTPCYLEGTDPKCNRSRQIRCEPAPPALPSTVRTLPKEMAGLGAAEFPNTKIIVNPLLFGANPIRRVAGSFHRESRPYTFLERVECAYRPVSRVSGRLLTCVAQTLRPPGSSAGYIAMIRRTGNTMNGAAGDPGLRSR